MTLRSIAYIALAIFCLLYGLMSVTSITVKYMADICGFAALIAGILMFILGIRQSQSGVA